MDGPSVTPHTLQRTATVASQLGAHQVCDFSDKTRSYSQTHTKFTQSLSFLLTTQIVLKSSQNKACVHCNQTPDHWVLCLEFYVSDYEWYTKWYILGSAISYVQAHISY